MRLLSAGRGYYNPVALFRPRDMMFRDGPIDGVIFRAIERHADSRGWLLELFRSDELPAEYHPQMAYLSQTLPGVIRGPHEHSEQSDIFVFAGPGDFRLFLWDMRPESNTHRRRHVIVVGQSNPQNVIVPPGVVHAYKNIGSDAGWVLNCPNRLYAGPGRREPVDEIRHEAKSDSPFVIE